MTGKYDTYNSTAWNTTKTKAPIFFSVTITKTTTEYLDTNKFKNWKTRVIATVFNNNKNNNNKTLDSLKIKKSLLK